VNFDTVGGPEPLRYMRREGIGRTWAADTALLGVAERIGEDHPETGLRPNVAPIGLTYDVTPVLARGGRALTFITGADDGTISNYHWPTDTPENVDASALDRALIVGRRMAAAIDGGEAD
jgi:hypothetical protein